MLSGKENAYLSSKRYSYETIQLHLNCKILLSVKNKVTSTGMYETDLANIESFH